jgi:excisionase family DNA binding protein
LNNPEGSVVEVLKMNSNEIMNIKEVSHYLKIPVSTVYKLVQDRKVPAIKLGKHLRFMKRDLDYLFKQIDPEGSK